MNLYLAELDSPIGPLKLVWSGNALRALDFDSAEDRFHRLLQAHYGAHTLRTAGVPDELRRPLESYFEGDLNAIDSVPVETGGTPFQKQVWAELRRIRPGTTSSYGELATRIGRPGASRAVGLANGSNPVGIVVPCHRVIGANGTLTGYAGGLQRKQWLLNHERAACIQLALPR
jgi:methylated-DNA-[protein]-cysteine S-methyltransferase